MAENTEKLSDIDIDKDPLKYCKKLYEEAVDYNDSLYPKIRENFEFFEGKDPELEKRLADKRVTRSAMFIQEIRPAIQTRWTTIEDRLQSAVGSMIKMTGKKDYAENEAFVDKLNWMQEKLGEILTNTGYLYKGIEDHFMGAELMNLSAVKVEWAHQFDYVAKTTLPPMDLVTILKKFIKKEPPPEPRTEWIYKEISQGIGISSLAFNEFLYPRRARSLEESPYIGHRRFLTKDDVRAEAARLGWKKNAVNEMIAHGSGSERKQNNLNDDVYDEGNKSKVQDTDGLYSVIDWYIPTYPEGDGSRPITRTITVGDNKHLLKVKNFECPGIKYPFVTLVAWPRLHSIEGTSSVDLGRPLQRLHSDCYNAIMDAASYGIFAPTLQESGVEFEQEPVWGLGAIWKGKNIDRMKQLELNLGPIDIMPQLAEQSGSILRQLLNSTDVMQATDAQYDEKAVRTKLRFSNAMRRTRQTSVMVEAAIVRICEIIIRLNQSHNTDWNFDTVEVDDPCPYTISVPSLSGIDSSMEEREYAVALYQMAMASPLYAGSPEKIRKLLINVFEKFKIEDIDAVVPTEEEITINPAPAPDNIDGQLEGQPLPGQESVNPQEVLNAEMA